MFNALRRRLIGFEYVTVVTSFHAAGYETYGRRFLESFEQYWPFNYRLQLYLEGLRLNAGSPRTSALDLLEAVPALARFRERHATRTLHCGQVPGRGYDYRYDAVKFANKAFAIAHAGRNCRTRLLVWLDADTVTLKPVPANWVRELIGEEAFVAYLGRRGMHSETGFLAFDLGRPDARRFFDAYQALYTSDEIFNLREWHDCEAFDVTRALFAAQGRIRCRNLSPDGTLHPFVNSRLGEYLDHMKGTARKLEGRSPDDDYSHFRGVRLPPQPPNLDSGRYAYLPWLIGILKPRTIIEVGTWSGHRALQMARAALAASPSVRYLGFDLFEEATPERDAAEKNVKPHYSEAQVDALLARFAASNPGFAYELTAGDSRKTLPELAVDLAFIDGGHSVETIRSDLARLRGCKTVILDDWYEGPIDTSRFGCNRVVENHPHIVLPHGDPVAGGGSTKFVVVGDPELLERIRSELASAPPLLDCGRLEELGSLLNDRGLAARSSGDLATARRAFTAAAALLPQNAGPQVNLADVCLKLKDYLASANACQAALKIEPGATRVAELRDALAKDLGERPATLYAFYDLAVSPVTFDFVTFLLLAEVERRRCGAQALRVIFVPGQVDGFREMTERDRAYGRPRKQWRVHNIQVPACRLVPACLDPVVCATRIEALGYERDAGLLIFPSGYSALRPIDDYRFKRLLEVAAGGDNVRVLEATPQAMAHVGEWLERNRRGRSAISITLRESDYQSWRNSDIAAWSRFAHWLEDRGYLPVIVPDTEAHLSGIGSTLGAGLEYPGAAVNVELRAALYRKCLLNLMVANGPLALCYAGVGVRYIGFILLRKGEKASSAEWFASEGLQPGSQPSFAGEFQRFAWDDQSFETIVAECEAMLAKLREAGFAAP